MVLKLGILLIFSPVFISAQIKPNNATYPTPTQAAPALPAGYNQNITVNYVRTWEAMKPNTNPSAADLADPAKYKQATAYFDGLGRPLQEVIKGASPDGQKDLVSMHTYDAFGRETINYLPYPAIPNGTDAGKFKTDPFSATQTYYQTNYTDQRPFSQTEIEPSPLNRPTKTMAPGNSWVGSGRGIEKQYLINTINDEVRIWNIGYNVNIELNIPTSTATYPAGQLYKNVTIDEHQKLVVEYTDKEGHVILKKVQLADIPSVNHTGWLCTYYVYDDFGLLRFVMQPKAVEYLNTNGWVLPVPPLGGGGGDVVAELCFRYEYDGRNRMTAKKVPGAGWVYMCYDKRDRLVYTQDANMRNGSSLPIFGGAGGGWMVTFYDALNRPTAAALYKTGLSQNQLQDALNGLVMENPTPSIAEGDLYRLSYIYYDNYTFSGAVGFEGPQLIATQSNYQLGDEVADNTTQATSTRGLVTGTKTRVLVPPLGGGTWQTATTYYDVNGKPLQAISTNHKGGKDIVTTQYSFTGKVISTVSKHHNPAATLAGTQTTTIQQTTLNSNNYAISTRQKINNDAWLPISTLQYDDMGKAKRKEMGNGYNMDGNAEKFFTNFSYNIRGWLTGVNKADIESAGNYAWTSTVFFKAIFAQKLSYDYGFGKSADYNAASTEYGQVNGNISGQVWVHAGNQRKRAFGYEYDNVNRLTKADYTEDFYGWRNSQGTWYENEFSVSNISYDANGNIKSMKQMGSRPESWGTLLDDMTYDYSLTSNKLKSVTDAITDTTFNLGDFKDNNKTGDDYTYDANGNMIADKNKGISAITYNYLNLPQTINVTNKGTITYTYDATGNKLQKIVTPAPPSGGGGGATTTDYLGAFQYQNSELQQVAHAEGRVRYAKRMTYNGQTAEYYWNYDFYYKDHLGNIRATVTEQQDQSRYTVTTEAAVQTQELSYTHFNPADTRTRSQIPGYANTAENNNRVIRTLTNGQRYMAYNTVLKVMAGDEVDIKVDYYYRNSETASDLGAPPQDWNYWGWVGLLYPMFGNMAGAINPAHLNSNQISGSGNSVNAWSIGNFLSNRGATTNSSRPKAYLNWVFMDENFKITESGSNWRQVGDQTTEFSSLVSEIPVKVQKSGYVYVWVSNESNTPVYFDDLKINHRAGPLLQEDDYYPFGLEMKMLGSRASGKQENKLKYNGKELQSDFDLEWTDYGARMYDGQIGRWHVVDPLAAHPKQIGMSPYSAFANNPIRYVDPTGMIWEDPKDAERLNKSVNSKIESIGKDNTKIQAQIDKGGLSEKKLGKLQDKLADNNSKVGLLNQSLADIKSIGEATETYALSSPSQSDGTHGVVKDSKGVIQIEGSNTGLHLHEIRHVGQSIGAGGVKFNKNGQLLNSATTISGGRNNEVNAYQVQFSFDGSYPAGASSLKDINGTTLMNIKKEDGTSVYEQLKDKK